MMPDAVVSPVAKTAARKELQNEMPNAKASSTKLDRSFSQRSVNGKQNGKRLTIGNAISSKKPNEAHYTDGSYESTRSYRDLEKQKVGGGLDAATQLTVWRTGT